jgi:heme/copper-type cytochrome/quinol oxidase subunit 4
MFDDRGLASAAMRLDYVNNGQSAVDHIALQIPGRDVKVVSAFVKEECLPENGSVRDYGYYYYDDCPYPGYSFVPAGVSDLGGGRYRIALNESIPNGKSTSVLVFYRAFGYVKDDITGKRFDFETPSFDFDVDGTRVAIDVDEDLYLKEGGSEGNYRSMKSTVMAGVPDYAGGSQNLQSALSSSYSYVGYASGYVRQKSTLLAGETFTLSGTYGRGWLQLHLPEIAAALLVLAGTGWFVRKKANEAAQRKADEDAGARMGMREKGGKMESGEKKSGLADAAVFSFMCAVGFALLISLAALAIVWSKTRMEDPGVLALVALLAWLSVAAYIYIQKSRDGTGLAAAMMFVGFSVIITPFMLLMALWIAAMLVYHPPYYY